MFGVDSDNSDGDYSASEDGDKNYSGNSCSSESFDQTNKTASNKKKMPRTMSNQSWTRNFQGLDLNSSFGTIPGYNNMRTNDQIENENENSTQMETDVGSAADNHRNASPTPEEVEELLTQRYLQSVQEGGGENEANLNRRLVAPLSEIQRRNKQKNNTSSESIESYRKKQNELLNMQIELHKILIENAKIAQKESNEKFMLAQALRKNAEANLNGNNANE